jgi:carbon-monoxide dehydrogenase large subunit
MNLNKALEISNYNKLRLEQRREREKRDGRLLGIGLCTYLEISTWSPDSPQTASISVTQSGKVTIVSGTSPHGQGHETPFAQIAAQELGISLDDIVVTYGDTAKLSYGTATGGSRSAALGGSAVLLCAKKIKEKMALIAGLVLDVDPSDLAFENGKIFDSRNPKRSLSFADVAKTSYVASKLPKGMEPTLFAYSAFAPKNWTFPFGTHVAVVEVSRETGKIKVLDYVAVDDVGTVLNPLLAEGQVHGGVMQGAGQALTEDVVYDSEGQLLTRSFMDYQIPLAEECFPIRWLRTNTPTFENPLGIKGIGENGTVACTPALANAVEDALAPFGGRVDLLPLKPDYLRSLIKASSKTDF